MGGLFKRFRKMKEGVLGTWLVSYVLVMLLPIVSAFVSITMSNRIIDDQTDTINTGLLSLLHEAVDFRITEIIQDYMHISTNERVTRLLSEKDIIDNYSSHSAYLLQNTLSSIVARNASLKHIYIHLFESDLLLSDATLSRSELFFQTEVSPAYNTVDLTYDDWIQLISSNDDAEFAVVSDSSGDYILYVVPLPRTTREAQATLVFQLQPTALTHLISGISTNEGMLVTVYSPSGLRLASNYQGELPENTREYAVSCIVSASTGLRFESHIPKNIYLKESDAIKRATYTVMSVSFCVCIMIIVLSLRRNYSPLRDLVEHLEKNLQVNNSAVKGEYAYLKDTFDIVLSNRQQDRQLLQERTEKLRQAYLVRLLLGRADIGIPVEEYFTLLQLDYTSGAFAVLLFEIDEEGKPDTGLSLRQIDLTRFNLYGHSVQIAGRTALLVDTARLDEHGLKCQVSTLYKELSNHFDGLVASVSTIHLSAAGICSAYDEALYSIEYALAMDADYPVFFADIAKSGMAAYYYPPEVERRLIEIIVAGNEAAARALMRHIWENNLKSAAVNQECLRLLLYNFISTSFKALAEQSGSSSSFFQQSVMIHRVQQIAQAPFERAYEQAEEMIGETCSSIQKELNNDNSKLYDSIVQYIEMNFADQNLSVEKICSVFGRSRSHLFNMFKGKTGDGVLTQIHMVRIQSAKKMLSGTDLSISEISDQVGYYNSVTFIRMFKRYEGVTPGKYREIIHQNKHFVD